MLAALVLGNTVEPKEIAMENIITALCFITPVIILTHRAAYLFGVGKGVQLRQDMRGNNG